MHAFYPENEYYKKKTTINSTLSCFCDAEYNATGYSAMWTRYTEDG